MKIKYIWLLLIFLGLVACDDDDNSNSSQPLPELSAGSADFSTYVSLGNSLTAGYTDNALFQAGQASSFPNLMSQKFALVGGGAFTQPYTNDNIGGLTLGGSVIASPRLFFDGSGPALLPATPTTEVSNTLTGPFNNMGVPGAKSFHLLANGYGNIGGLPSLANPYFVRMASNPNASVLEDAMAQNPSFFSLWIGNNDVLGYATTGGDGSNAITDIMTFTGAYNLLMSSLTSNGAKGVVANIPDVTTIPFFTTVPHNPLDPSNPAFGPQIPVLNATFAPLNAAFDFMGMPERKIMFSDSEASPVVIHDESLANVAATLSAVLQGGGLDPVTAGLLANQYGQSRQANSSDLLVLPSSSIIATVDTAYYSFLVGNGVPAATAGQLSVIGVTLPMADKWVLLPNEQQEVAVATEAFNSIIEDAATQAGIAFVDANSLMTSLGTTGVESNNFLLTADLVTGGAFSLDGVHLNSRGYALVANQMLMAIDTTYGSNFEASGNLYDIGEYPTNYPPTLQ